MKNCQDLNLQGSSLGVRLYMIDQRNELRTDQIDQHRENNRHPPMADLHFAFLDFLDHRPRPGFRRTHGFGVKLAPDAVRPGQPKADGQHEQRKDGCAQPAI